jgi:phage gp46-like protein
MDIELFNGCNPGDAADVLVACGGLSTGNELTTAVLISLFTDGRANGDDTIPDGSDSRGWWADALDGKRIGSRLWLLERARDLPETYRLAEDYANESLQWLLADGIASKITVKAHATDNCKGELDFTVKIEKPDNKSLAWKFRYAWDLRQLKTMDSCVAA